MKKYLLLALLIPNLVFALPQTLNSYMAKHSTWSSSDKASLSYITSRCGVVFLIISERYKNMDGGQNIYQMALMNAANFTTVSSDTYK